MLTARNGWAALLAGIILYEIFCIEEELLSRGFDRLLEKHPVWPRFLVVIVAAHLCNWLPQWADPLSLLFHRTKGLGRWGKHLKPSFGIVN